jgi:sulfatase modifying factor 1
MSVSSCAGGQCRPTAFIMNSVMLCGLLAASCASDASETESSASDSGRSAETDDSARRPVYGLEGQSCASMTGTECNGESCCTSIVVPGGTFPMGRGTETCTECSDGCPANPRNLNCGGDEQPEHPATISSFRLDKFEVTVGRFRAFVEAGAGIRTHPPAAGAGAHPLIAASGWDSAWDSQLAADRAQLEDWITCGSDVEAWTASGAANEQYPMNCTTWYEAFAFCIWDGGRLPTEAEWEYAAAGGDENRVFPWGNDVTEPAPADYFETTLSPGTFPPCVVGSYANGNGRWGHADLAGSVDEWVLDFWAYYYYLDTETGCSDCANLSSGGYRVHRGGSWFTSAAHFFRAAFRNHDHSENPLPHVPRSDIGIRCARSAE